MYYFIVNYGGGSGHGKKTWKNVRGILEAESVPYHAYRTKYPGHASRIATEIVRRFSSKQEPARIVVVGGDGTINEVLNGIMDFERVWLGVIPTGSGNDFARGHNLPMKTVPALMQVLNCTLPKKVDLGRVYGDSNAPRIFGISSGIGLDAEVCKKVDQSKRKKMMNGLGAGKLTYLWLTVESLFTMKTTTGRIVFDGDFEDVYHARKLIYLSCMNTCWEGGGVPMAPDASPEDGLLSTCSAAGVPRWQAFFKLLYLVRGKQEGRKGFMLRNGKTIDIEMEEPVVLHFDGEYGGDVRRIHMEVLPECLRLMKGATCRRHGGHE